MSDVITTMAAKIDALTLEGILGMLVLKLNRDRPGWLRVEITRLPDGISYAVLEPEEAGE